MNFMLRTGDPLLCAVGSRINLKFVLLLALLIRILFVYLGCIIDTYSLKYTDIDYHVFTDAAEFITQGVLILISFIPCFTHNLRRQITIREVWLPISSINSSTVSPWSIL